MTPLRRRMIEDMRIRNLSPQTQTAYVEQVLRFARHFGRSPERWSSRDPDLADPSGRGEAPGGQFDCGRGGGAPFCLCRHPQTALDLEDDIPTGRQPKKLPVVPSPEEVGQFLDAVSSPKHRMILTVCYAAGLRISEAVCLKPSAIDSQRMVIRVEAGKGRKDRYVMLSPRLLDLFREYWKTARPKEWLFPGRDDRQPINGHG